MLGLQDLERAGSSSRYYWDILSGRSGEDFESLKF